uniref:Uncharacterized protein n=1 Tax=Rhizophora mucronata TaxID=61149 RepID=A0A2P2J1L7_RHIMU
MIVICLHGCFNTTPLPRKPPCLGSIQKSATSFQPCIETKSYYYQYCSCSCCFYSSN